MSERPKLGKTPATPEDRDFRLTRYLTELPKPPKKFGFGLLYPAWGMLGNDRYGDCVFAGAAHETMVWTKLRRGIGTSFDDKSVLSDYAALTGFDPSDPGSDNGTDMGEAAHYRQKSGIGDAHGVRHRIAAYVWLDKGDWSQLVTAMYIFGCVGIGFEFPDTAWDQFDQGLPWEVTDLDSPIDGGHYVPGVGTQMSTDWLACVTWGRRQIMAREFYEDYSDEAVVYLSEEQIRSDGKGLHGFDLDTLKKDLEAL